MREKTHTSMLVVTIREGEERGICSAALKALLKMSKIRLRNEAVIIVMNRESASWRKASLKSAIRENQLKYVDAKKRE